MTALSRLDRPWMRNFPANFSGASGRLQDIGRCLVMQSILTRFHATVPSRLITSQEIKVRRYIIERDIPHVGDCSFVQLRQAARTSNAALAALGPDIQWVESYAANDRMFCVYLAKNEMIILNHAD